MSRRPYAVAIESAEIHMFLSSLDAIAEHALSVGVTSPTAVVAVTVPSADGRGRRWVAGEERVDGYDLSRAIARAIDRAEGVE